MATASFLFTLLCMFFLAFLGGSIWLAYAIRKVPDNEQWVITRMGNTFVKGPGWMMQLPLVDRIEKVNLGEKSTNVQDQTCITLDRAPTILHMLVYSHAIDAQKYASQTARNREDFLHLCSSTLKEMVSERMLDQVLSAREELGAAVCDKLNRAIDPALGIRIEKVQIMEVVVSKEILAAMAAPGKFPSECPACGAPLNNPQSKGTRQIECEYCGFLIKL